MVLLLVVGFVASEGSEHIARVVLIRAAVILRQAQDDN